MWTKIMDKYIIFLIFINMLRYFYFIFFSPLQSKILYDFPADYVYEGKYIQPILNINELNVNINVFTCFGFDKEFHKALVKRYGDYLTHILHFITFKSVPFKDWDKDIEECYKLCVIFVSKVLYYDSLFEIDIDEIVKIKQSTKINIAYQIMVERMFQMILDHIRLKCNSETFDNEIKSFKNTLKIINRFSFEQIDVFRNFLCIRKYTGRIHLRDHPRRFDILTYFDNKNYLKNELNIPDIFFYNYNYQTLSEKISHFFFVFHDIKDNFGISNINEFNEDLTDIIKIIICTEFKYEEGFYNIQYANKRNLNELNYKIMIKHKKEKSFSPLDLAYQLKNFIFNYDQEYTNILELISLFYKNSEEIDLKSFEEILQYFGKIYSNRNEDINLATKIIISCTMLCKLKAKNSKYKIDSFNLLERYTISREIEIKVNLFYDRVINCLSLKYISEVYNIIKYEYNDLSSEEENTLFAYFREFYMNLLFLNTLNSNQLDFIRCKNTIYSNQNFIKACIFNIFNKLNADDICFNICLTNEKLIHITKKIYGLKQKRQYDDIIDIKMLDVFAKSNCFDQFYKKTNELIKTRLEKEKRSSEVSFNNYKITEEISYVAMLENIRVLRKVKIPFIVNTDIYNRIELLKLTGTLENDITKINEKFKSGAFSSNSDDFIYFYYNEIRSRFLNEKKNFSLNEIEISKSNTNNIDNIDQNTKNYQDFEKDKDTKYNDDVSTLSKISKNFSNNMKLSSFSDYITRHIYKNICHSSKASSSDISSYKNNPYIKNLLDKIITTDYISDEDGLRSFFDYFLYNLEKKDMNLKSCMKKTENIEKSEVIVVGNILSYEEYDMNNSCQNNIYTTPDNINFLLKVICGIFLSYVIFFLFK